MPELPQKKVGIIACSGEELPEGTVTRLAALQVLEKLRPSDTVTICLPLFLAGGEGDRAFAKFYPTIAIDGCDKRCAYRATEKYSNKPAAGIVITDLIEQHRIQKPQGTRRLDAAGQEAVVVVAEEMATKVDELLGKTWSRRQGTFAETSQPDESQEEVEATCSCGSGIPIQKVQVNGQEISLVALPLIFQNLFQHGKIPGNETGHELMEMIKIYNSIESAVEADVELAVQEAYTDYYLQQEVKA
ncbi:MAG: putative zinc-binding protein [Anaerolineaceae bacterium]